MLRPQHRLGGEPDILFAAGALDRTHLAQPLGHRQPLAQVVVGDIAGEVSLLDHRSPFSEWRVDGHIIECSQRGVACSISARKRAGVTGNSRMRRSSGRNASSIAETIAAGAPMVPLSAAPLTPSGFDGLGDSM